MSENPAPEGRHRAALSRNFAWGLGILAFWLVMMGLLIWRQHAAAIVTRDAPPVSPAAIERNWRDTADYALILVGNLAVGATVTTMSRIATNPPAYLIQAAAAAGHSGLPGPSPLAIEVAARLDAQFYLSSFEAAGRLPTSQFVLRGLVQFPDLYIESRVGEAVRRVRFRLEKPVSLADQFRSVAFRSIAIKPGLKYSVEAVDPLWSFRLGRVEVEVGDAEEITLHGQKQLAYRITTRWGNVATNGWVDATGRVLRQQLFGTVALERASQPEVQPFLGGPALLSGHEELDPAAFRNIPPEPLTQESLLGLGITAPALADTLGATPAQ
jgi:hypothetical protein